jgi:uncharacterized protein (TIGR04255 family)
VTFPVSDRVVYAERTLNQVISQVQFPTILTIGTDAPTAYQERVRERYPLYEQQLTPNLPPEIAGIFAQMPIKQPETVLHKFSTADEKRSITLGAQFLAVTDEAYEEWPVLRPEIEFAQAALEAIYRPAFYTRVGLRYQDVVDRDSVGLTDVPWADLFNPAIAGLLGASEAAIREGVSEYITNALVALDGVDGASVRLTQGLARDTVRERTVYLIDADYFLEGQQQQGSQVLELLNYFNSEAGNLFRWAIADPLRDALGDRDRPRDD